jgi:peptide/nickel transport system substrate-binding protein
MPAPRRSRLLPGLAALLLATACGESGLAIHLPTDDVVPEAMRYGGTVVFAGPQALTVLNPLTTVNVWAIWINREMLFTPLFLRDADLRLVPALAHRWELSPDSSVLTLHLRDDVRWHDGVRTTAHDLHLGYMLARDPASGSIHAGGLAHFGEGEVVDSFTYRLAVRPRVDYLSPLASVFPLPRHVLGGVPPGELHRHPFASRPLGNGPFRLATKEPGASWTFEASDGYPEALGGRPYLDRLVYRHVPEPTTRLVELLTGAVDVTPVEPGQHLRVEAAAAARVLAYSPPLRGYVVWNARRPPFDDLRVRRALAMAIDRRGIVEGVLYGAADVGGSYLPPSIWAHDPQAAAGLDYAPDVARRLLAEAGWLDRDGDGVLENAAGRELRFTLDAARGRESMGDVLEKVVSDLRVIGVRAESRVLESTARLARLRQREYDAALVQETAWMHADAGEASFHCAWADRGNVHAGICDPDLDRFGAALVEVVDTAVAKPLWERYQRMVAGLQPMTILFYPHEMIGVGDRLRDVRPDARGAFSGVRKWWLAPS